MASFAVESYQTLFLKTYYPLVFMVEGIFKEKLLDFALK